MQEQTNDGVYLKPELLNDKKLKEAQKRLNDGSTKRLLIFAARDSGGNPTKEMRRAWRRYNRTNKHFTVKFAEWFIKR